MGRWQREALTEGQGRNVAGPSIIRFAKVLGSSSPPDWTWIAGGNPTLHSPSPSLPDREDIE